MLSWVIHGKQIVSTSRCRRTWVSPSQIRTQSITELLLPYYKASPSSSCWCGITDQRRNTRGHFYNFRLPFLQSPFSVLHLNVVILLLRRNGTQPALTKLVTTHPTICQSPKNIKLNHPICCLYNNVTTCWKKMCVVHVSRWLLCFILLTKTETLWKRLVSESRA